MFCPGSRRIYVLNKKEFVHAMGSQWVSYNEQIPVDIIEIDVDDYADEYSIVLPGVS